jgi:hypothetical protein
MNNDELAARLSNYERRGLVENGGKYYDDFESNEFYIPTTMYSDYFGGTVEKSNCIFFQDKFHFLDTRHLSYHGGSIVFTLDDLWEAFQENRDSVEEFFSDLDSLEDYLVLDENLLGNIELEIEQEMWSGCYRHDFICSLQTRFNLDDDAFDIISANPDDVYALFLDLCDLSNTYWVMEGASSAYIDVDRVAKVATFNNILNLLGLEK